MFNILIKIGVGMFTKNNQKNLSLEEAMLAVTITYQDNKLTFEGDDKQIRKIMHVLAKQGIYIYGTKSINPPKPSTCTIYNNVNSIEDANKILLDLFQKNLIQQDALESQNVSKVTMK